MITRLALPPPRSAMVFLLFLFILKFPENNSKSGKYISSYLIRRPCTCSWAFPVPRATDWNVCFESKSRLRFPRLKLCDFTWSADLDLVQRQKILVCIGLPGIHGAEITTIGLVLESADPNIFKNNARAGPTID